MQFIGIHGQTVIDNVAEKILAAGTMPYTMLAGLDSLKRDTIELLELCLGALYSGICGKRLFQNRPRLDSLRETLVRVSQLMPRLIATAGVVATRGRYSPAPDTEGVTWRFIETLPAIQTHLGLDLRAAYEGDPAATGIEEIILSYPCVEAIATYRLANLLYRGNVPLIPRLMTEWSHSRTGIDIHPGASIDPGFFIDHGTGVVIGETSVIGKGVKIYQGVTLGARSFKKGEDGALVKGLKRHPNIEDNVTIYAGATILGGETTIGRNTVIGGNCWVTESVPANSVVSIENEKSVVKSKPINYRQLAG